jgi:hypothetical protein
MQHATCNLLVEEAEVRACVVTGVETEYPHSIVEGDHDDWDLGEARDDIAPIRRFAARLHLLYATGRMLASRCSATNPRPLERERCCMLQ